MKYGSKYKDKEKLFEIIRLEEEFIISKKKKLKIWVDLYKTSISNEVLQELIKNVERIGNNTERISFVGLSGLNEWRLKRGIKRAGMKIVYSCYADPEDAKTWLVSD